MTAESSAAPLLVLRDLQVAYPQRGILGARRTHAVRGVSFELNRGETLGLVGESGCGKTSVARAVARLVSPRGGQVIFDGMDVHGLRGLELKRYRRRVQVVFQDPFGSLNPRKRAGAVLGEVLRVHSLAADGAERATRALELLECVGLSRADCDRYPHELSGGQRQRLGIARALATAPDLIVLDEPVSSLDVSVTAQVLALLAGLQRDFGLTYLFIAHDLAVVERVSDRVAVMYAGRIVETGSARDIFGAPRHPYTRSLLSAIPHPDPLERPRRRAVLSGDVEVAETESTGCAFHPRCPHPGKDDRCLELVPLLEPESSAHQVACVKAMPRGSGPTPVSDSSEKTEMAP